MVSILICWQKALCLPDGPGKGRHDAGDGDSLERDGTRLAGRIILAADAPGQGYWLQGASMTWGVAVHTPAAWSAFVQLSWVAPCEPPPPQQSRP